MTTVERLVAELVGDDRLTGATLSKPRRSASAPAARVTIDPVLVQGALRYRWTSHHGARALDENLTPGETARRLAHVLGGLGLPHGESHAIILSHVTRFNLAAAPQARAQLALALSADDPAARIAAMLEGFPIPHRLRDIGFDRGKIEFVAGEMAKLGIATPRPVSGADVRNLLESAY